MRYAQTKGGNKLHLVFELPTGGLSQPICGIKATKYRMTINAPMGQACERCRSIIRSGSFDPKKFLRPYFQTIILILSINFAFAQDTVSICKTSVGLGLTGELTGTYWANFISLDTAWVHDADLYATRYFVSESVIDSTASLHVVNCMEAAEACTDRYIPGVAVLGDSSIRDEEWEENYADVLTDSAAFFSLEAMMLYQKFGVKAVDDCGINQFFVKSLEIEPPGGVDRPSGTRTFRINFRAVDFAGRIKEAQMVWVRDNTGI